MADYSALEIALSRRDEESYAVQLRYTQPDDDAEVPEEIGVARFDRDALRQRQTLNTAAYGRLLSESLFADQQLHNAFDKASALSLSQGNKMRVRLYIGRSAPELHSLWWETLQDPRRLNIDSRLADDQRVIFSRYLRSDDWRPVKLRRKSELRALIVIADPDDLEQYNVNGRQLTKVDVEGETDRALAALGEAVKGVLSSRKAPTNTTRVTLTLLLDELAKGYDILYLVCHGALIKDKKDRLSPHLYLESEDGKASAESGLEFVDRLRKLAVQPRLVVLASCQSSGRNSDVEGALAALGPKLAEAGVPAVVAMQGDVTMETVEGFMPTFFEELSRHGHVEEATAAARFKVSERADSWMPVLFTRLRTGRIWYEPGLRSSAGGGEFERWPVILKHINGGRCTPIVGPGVLESLVGSSHDIARDWADTYHYPMSPHYREDLPNVAQFLRFNLEDPTFPYDSISTYLHQKLLDANRDILTPELLATPEDELGELLKFVGAYRRQNDSDEPHRVLASLPFKIYITTNTDNLLSEALEEVAGKTPHKRLCPWNDYVNRKMMDAEDYEPTDKEPLVYYLFGQLDDTETMVLTEDDYFDYLIGTTKNKELFPDPVVRAQTASLLLFLGFQVSDWDFRVIFRSIMSWEGKKAGSKDNFTHVAVQINPDEDTIIEPSRARKYLEKYFNSSNVSIYWGSAEDFLRELRQRWNQSTYGRSKPI